MHPSGRTIWEEAESSCRTGQAPAARTAAVVFAATASACRRPGTPPAAPADGRRCMEIQGSRDWDFTSMEI
jgi:hypothetical protein